MPRTHYDNLQISQSASNRVIKAAYKSLAHHWHPDRNPDQINKAERNIKIINEAYRVLIDPELRLQHDRWIEHTKDDLRNDRYNNEHYESELNQEYRENSNADSNEPSAPQTRLPWKSTWWIGAIIGVLVALIPDDSTGFTPLSEIALSLQTGAPFTVWGPTLIGMYLAGCIFALIIVAVIRGIQK